MPVLPRRHSQSGMTLTELLIVVTVVAVLFILLILSMTKQVSRSRDAERKADLEKIKIAFEEYHNDNGCYPPIDVLMNCNSSSFLPYLQAIPCDPISEEPYYYVPLSGDTCNGYRVYAGLENSDDPIIGQLACDGDTGCGYGSNYNYGVSAGVPVYDPDGVPPASPDPTPAPTPSPTYVYACVRGVDEHGQPNATCNLFEENNPYLGDCPITFPNNGQCQLGCLDSVNWCD